MSRSRPVVLATAAAVLLTAVATSAAPGESRSERAPAAATRDDPLSDVEVKRLTSPGPIDMDTWDDARAQQAYQQLWGVADIRLVSGPLTDANDRFPLAAAGVIYDPVSLTFTQWVRDSHPQGPFLRWAAREAFDEAAAGSNLHLVIKTSPGSLAGYDLLRNKLHEAFQNDPDWPRFLDLTGGWEPALGRYAIHAGDRYDDPGVQAYFEERWPGQVAVTVQGARHDGGGGRIGSRA